MNIGFDGKRAANNTTGLGNYSRAVITQLTRAFPQNQYFVYTSKVKDHDQIKSFFKLPGVLLRLKKSLYPLWRSIGIKKQLLTDRIDLYHGLSHEIPLGLQSVGIPAIVTIHDLIFLLFPSQFGVIDRIIYRFKFAHACKSANQIIAISERTKQDIIRFFRVDEEKIEVIYQSCDDSFKSPVEDNFKKQVLEKYHLPSKYILNVGTIEQRKNLATLVKAMKFVDPDYKLVVVGKATVYLDEVKKEIEKLGLNSRIIFLHDVSFADLPAIYQMAKVFIYPSVYEGFGIPILEALYSGVPVVAATGSCLEEAGGENSLYVDAYDATGFSSAINSIIENDQLRNKMIVQGLLHSKKFENEKIASQMMATYNQTVKNFMNYYAKN